MSDPITAPPTKRMTTAEVAALAQDIDGRLDDLSAVVTDINTRLQDAGQSTPGSHADLITPDAVDGRIHEALQPLHDEVHELRGSLNNPATPSNLNAILTRLEDVERKAVSLDPGALVEQASAALHPSLQQVRARVDEITHELRKRVDKVEQAQARLDADPVSHTLAEDALADQIQATVERALTDLSTTSDASRARVDQLERNFADLRQHVEAHGTHVTRALVNEVTSALPTTTLAPVATNGLGAARKVLKLMQAVTHIGKDRQAEMGTGGSFRFRGIDEAMDAVGHAMREVGLILSPEVLKEESSTTPVTKKGNGKSGPYESTVLWTTTKLTMRYTFVDPDDGSAHPIEMVGEGRDASDKSTSKAGSMAFKYALLQALCIPVTGLDDSDASPPQIMENERTHPPTQDTRVSPRQAGESDEQHLARLQADQQSMPEHRPQRTEQDKARRAGEALAAIRNVYRVQGGPPAQQARLLAIMQQVQAEGLLQFTVEGSTLDQHGQAAMRTLQAPPPPEPEHTSQPPMNNEDAGEYY